MISTNKLKLELATLGYAKACINQVVMAVDDGIHYAFVESDLLGGYQVGRFKKSTIGSNGSYVDQPLLENATIQEALDFMADNFAKALANELFRVNMALVDKGA
jgi:hypothetical protein